MPSCYFFPQFSISILYLTVLFRFRIKKDITLERTPSMEKKRYPLYLDTVFFEIFSFFFNFELF